ncbi:MAG: bifunctional UDP-sugar hydrolase/5'-nucleotidase [Methylococcaceae bacterium]|nr:bifunctional UDP-sugar hydrolase/5'-nucleotidase [Methylococcaceae bacterium]
MKFKPAIGIAAFIALSLAACTLNPAAPAAEAHFSILQVNDSYKIEGLEKGRIGGFARLRTLRRQLEQRGGSVLVLHGGDFLFPSVMSKFLKADPMIRVLNLMDGDAAAYDPRLLMVFGNHEFDDKDPGLVLGRIAQSDFDWVSSNTYYRSAENAKGEPFSKRLNNIHDVVIKEIDGIKIGIFGITLDAGRQPYVAYDYELEPRRTAIRNAIASLKEKGARMIIALTHQDFDQDQWLAREYPEVNLIVGGHEHFFIEKQIGQTWITKADADNASAVIHDVQVHADGRVETRHRKISLDSTVEKDQQVQAEVEKSLDKLAQVFKGMDKDLQQVVGQTQYLLEGVEPAVRGRETALGDFLADVIRERMKTDVAFTNGGGIRINDNIPPGPVITYDMEGIFYYDNSLASFRISGAQLLDILRNSVSKSHLGDGRFLQVSGIRFKYHPAEADGKIIYRIEAADIEVKPRGSKNYQPLDLNRLYLAATTDFIWEKGYSDGYEVFSKGAGKTSPERLDKGLPIGFRQSVEEAIASLPNKTITNRVEGRISRVE